MTEKEFAFEERAAILEYCGGYSRADAERLAREQLAEDSAGKRS